MARIKVRVTEDQLYKSGTVAFGTRFFVVKDDGTEEMIEGVREATLLFKAEGMVTAVLEINNVELPPEMEADWDPTP